MRDIEALRAILFNDWDPIGFAPLLPRDEYDNCIPGIILLLESHCGAEPLESHLLWLEREWFGVSSESGNPLRAARKLIGFWNAQG